MQYRPNDEKYLTDGIPDEDKVLADLENIKERIVAFNVRVGKVYAELSEAQKSIIVALSGARNSGYTKEFNNILTDIMSLKNETQNMYDMNIYPLLFFIERVDHLRALKKAINEDEYLKSKWNEIMLYMRMKD